MQDILILWGDFIVDYKILKERGVKFDAKLGYNGNLLFSGEDVDFIKALVQENDLCGFTEYGAVKHYINQDKLTMKWMLKRVYSEGVTQWYKYGMKDFFHELFQLPLRMLVLIGSLFLFKSVTIGKCFFKLIHCFGVLSGPLFFYRIK